MTAPVLASPPAEEVVTLQVRISRKLYRDLKAAAAASEEHAADLIRARLESSLALPAPPRP